MNCSEVGDREWILQRFSEKCYFYPSRDCPGWERGKLCARIQQTIPKEEDECDHDYLPNVDRTTEWCQKCDSVRQL